jgi:hypothetical protein
MCEIDTKEMDQPMSSSQGPLGSHLLSHMDLQKFQPYLAVEQEWKNLVALSWHTSKDDKDHPLLCLESSPS